MKIVKKVPGENLELKQRIEQDGYEAKLVRGGIIVTLKEEDGKYKYPPVPGKLFIDISEAGGGMTSRGSARIVCGLGGERLRPYYIKRSGHRACGEHCWFSVPSCVVVNWPDRREDICRIVKLSIKDSGGYAEIVEEEIWSGEYESLPELYQAYVPAIEAARSKANCYHCREPHYILEDA